MMWAQITGYLLISSVAITIMLWIYAILLIKFGQSGKVVKWMGASFLYFVVVGVLIGLFSMPFGFGEQWAHRLRSDSFFLVYFCVLFVVSLVPGMLFVRRNYLSRLRVLGYFKTRNYRGH